MELYGKSDIVDQARDFVGRNDAADGRLDRDAGARGFFDARRGLGAHVQIETPGVGGGKEILAQPRHQKERRCARRQKQQE